MHSFTGSSLRSFPFIGHFLAAFIIVYGSITATYAADTVNINTASIEVLAEELVGVGPELAKRIVDFRERYGEFKSIEALCDVRGIARVCLPRTKEKSYLSRICRQAERPKATFYHLSASIRPADLGGRLHGLRRIQRRC